MPFVSLNHPDSAKVLLTSSTNITKCTHVEGKIAKRKWKGREDEERGDKERRRRESEV
jgi:hypothetical protein